MGGLMTCVVIVNKDDVLRWMMYLFGWGGGGWVGVNDVRCYLQRKMMFFAG